MGKATFAAGCFWGSFETKRMRSESRSVEGGIDCSVPLRLGLLESSVHFSLSGSREKPMVR